MNAMGLPGRLRALKTAWMPLAPVAGDGLTVKDRGRDRPADVAEPDQPWKANQLPARAAERVRGAMSAHVELDAAARRAWASAM